MPEIGLLRSATLATEIDPRGHYKHPLIHPDDPDRKLILKTGSESWDQDILKRPELSPQQKHSFFLANFYSRRLAHLIFPAIFPNCIATNQNTLVVEKITGRELEDDREIYDEERLNFYQAVQALGLSLHNVDQTNPNNFIRDSQGLHYIDDLFFPVDNYFEVLMMAQRPLHRFAEYPAISWDWAKSILEKLEAPRNLSMSIQGNFEIFDVTMLKQTIASLRPQTQRQAVQLLRRLAVHEATFPQISLPQLKAKLNLFLLQK